MDTSADLAEAAEDLNNEAPAKVREPSALKSTDGSSARRQSLDLGAIGNCTIAALIDRAARMVWCCYPRIDSDTIFDDLINRSEDSAQGVFEVELEHLAECTQAYQRNTAILRTVLTDTAGAKVEVVDFAPRFKANDRIVRPPVLVRRIVPLSGSPRITLRVRPHAAVANERFVAAVGSNHVSYHRAGLSFRITAENGVSYLAEEVPFVLSGSIDLILGSDHYLSASVAEQAREFFEKTEAYWVDWCRYLSVPFEWQDVVIRAAITLKLCSFEETGAIIAALTTSIPEAPNSERNWDYRYCWLRDAYFVVNALNALGTTKTMEEFIAFITNTAALVDDQSLKPVYGVVPGHSIIERPLPDLAGYRGSRPVRVGNDAHAQVQNDVYGSSVLAATQMFFDERLPRQGDLSLFARLEKLGMVAARVAFAPDASLWELRGTVDVNTYTSAMCWAACDRLSAIANRLNMQDRAEFWSRTAIPIKERVLKEGWNERRRTFVATLNGDELDASLLLLHEIGIIAATDERYVATVDAIGKALRCGDHLMRYSKRDDFGWPQTAFIVCTFWYVDALVAIGRRDEARTIFEAVLACRNHVGLLSEDLDPVTGELWGNFPQSYSMVGLINSAVRLSKPWNTALLRVRD